MGDADLSQTPENWTRVGDGIAAGIANHFTLDGFSDALVNAFLKFHLGKHPGAGTVIKEIASLVGKLLIDLEEPVLPIIAAFVAPIVGSMFGTDSSVDNFVDKTNRDGRGAIASGMVDAFIQAITGDASGPQDPSDEGAKRIAAAGLHAALEGAFNAAVPELISDFLPFEVGHFTALTGLSEDMIRSLGIGRLTRRAIQPLVDATAVEPMRWKANKDYRPKLLSEATAMRQFQRGRWAWDDVVEELSRIGYSDERIDALKNELRKFVSAADVALLARHIDTGTFDPVSYLGEAGYDESDAQRALLVEDTRRLEAEQDTLAVLYVDAFAKRAIDPATFESGIRALSMPQADQDRYITRGQVRQATEIKFLTPAEAEACFLADVVPIAFYRDALQHAGYEPDSALALELLLETKKNKLADVAALKQTKTAAAAAAKQATADKAAARQVELDKQRALKAEGPLAAWKHAVVTGLVPIEHYTALLAERYDADTVATLTAQAQADRAAEVIKQQKAADAAKRAAEKGLNVGQLQQAVFNGILTVNQFRAALDNLKIAAPDADVLTATVQQRLADLTAAKATRAAAAAKAKTKSIDLARFELLVVKGHRSMADYTAFLSSLGYDEPSIAGMVDVLNIKIATAASARSTRASVAAQGGAVSLTFAELRRAVVLGDAPIDDFAKFLVDHNFTVDAQGVLLAELRDDVASAEAARAKRAGTRVGGGDSHLTLTTLARAARLGVIPPADYQQALTAAGYTADDVAVEMDLLTVEIQKTAAQRGAASSALASVGGKGVTLAQLATAVKLGDSSIDEYQAALVGAGYDAAAITTLVAVLTDEATTAADARARHETIAGELAQKTPSLATLEKGVTDGLMTIDAYRARLIQLGYAPSDADLLVSLLQLKIGPAGG